MPEAKKVIILGASNIGIASAVARELAKRNAVSDSTLPGEEHTNIVTVKTLDPSSFEPVSESEKVLAAISRKGVGPTDDE